MSNSTDKMDVQIGPTKWGKNWVFVTLKRSKTFLPSFEDLFRIVNAISICEEEKYPNGKGRKMVAEFMYDACMSNDYEVLARKYKIPVRQGETLLESNGAKTNNAAP